MDKRYFAIEWRTKDGEKFIGAIIYTDKVSAMEHCNKENRKDASITGCVIELVQVVE